MADKVIKIAILTNVLPVYRRGFYESLFLNEKYKIKVFCQANLPGSFLKLIHDEFTSDQVQHVSFHSFLKNSFFWQHVPWREIIKYDVIFIDGNPRILNHLLMATVFRLLNKSVVLWCMVHSFRNNKIGKWLRIIWMKIFKYLFLYNDSEVEYLKSINFHGKIMIGMNNGLDQKTIIKEILRWPPDKLYTWQQNNFHHGIDIVTLGRILKGKYDLLLYAISYVKKDIPSIKCCMIGEGDASGDLQKLAEKLDIVENIIFAGALYQEKDLAPYLLSSKMLVHPTSIGLTIMHAFGYGLPVITHNAIEFHGPEIVALQENYNGILYAHNSISDLADKILLLYNDTALRNKLSFNAKKTVTEKYNAEQMVDNFNSMVLSVSKNIG